MNFKERLRRRCEFDASLVYGTRKFNLMTGRLRHSDYRKENDARWLDPKTGLIAKRYSEKRRCPLCGADRYDVIFVKAGFPHVKCVRCGLVYVTPILNRDEYVKLWKDEDSWERVLENRHQIMIKKLEARYSLDVAGQYLKRGKDIDICDVGCGPGTLLLEAKRRGYRVFGVEPNKKTHDILRKNGIPFTGEFFPLKSDAGRRFDCVFVLNALEHMRDPLLVVRQIKKMLKRGGIIFVSAPCIDALVNRIMHEKAGVFGGHSHLQFFNVQTMSKLFRKTGLKVLEYETIISEIGVIENYLGMQDPYFGDCRDKLEFLTPEMVYKNHLARNLNMIGRLVR